MQINEVIEEVKDYLIDKYKAEIDPDIDCGVEDAVLGFSIGDVTYQFYIYKGLDGNSLYAICSLIKFREDYVESSAIPEVEGSCKVLSFKDIEDILCDTLNSPLISDIDCVYSILEELRERNLEEWQVELLSELLY